MADEVRSRAHEALVVPERLDGLLGGDWLGHRVHPVAAQVPMGAWAMAVLLDLAGSERHAAAVDTLMATGCLAALPTALAGVAVAGTGAYLGGHLVYRLGVGVEAP